MHQGERSPKLANEFRLNPQFAPAQLYRTEIDIVPALSQTFVNSVRRGLSEEREGFRRSPQGDHAQTPVRVEDSLGPPFLARSGSGRFSL
jgi:hypothetical protein